MELDTGQGLVAALALAAALFAGCYAVGAENGGQGPQAGSVGEAEPEDAVQQPGLEAEQRVERNPGVDVRASFAEAGEVERWAPVDDVVMGGMSSSALLASGEGMALFAGEVSLENNGGFASVRSRPRDWRMGGARGIALRVRGDGKTYKLGVRTEGTFDGVTWQASFGTVAGEWQTVRVPFEELVPRWRGRLVREAGPLEPASIRTLGLQISDKQVGAFQLEVEWIAAWR